MRKCSNSLIPWMFMAPALIILTVFTIYPILCGSALAFFNFSLLSFNEDGSLMLPKWIGVQNFIRLSKDIYFHTALKNSVMYVMMVPILQLMSIAAAYCVREDKPICRLARTLLYLPAITSSVVIGIVWKRLLRTDGIINQILDTVSFGMLDPIPWLTNADSAIFSIMLVTLWQGIGYYMILYLAGFQAIPSDIEECASLDGASEARIFFSIDLPLLKPAAAVCSLLSVISALKVFTEVYIMTGGGPQNSTLTASYYIYTTAFENFDMGYAASMALTLAAVIGTASLGHKFLFSD